MTSKDYLRAQLRTILQQNDAVLEHEWLCHPGERCKDGCDMSAIPERLAVYTESVAEEIGSLDMLQEDL